MYIIQEESGYKELGAIFNDVEKNSFLHNSCN